MKTAIRQKKRKGWRFWLTLLMLTVWMVPCAQAEMAEQSAPLTKDKVVRVACPHTEGYIMRSADGQPYGVVVDYLNEIAKYTGWQYEYIDTDGTAILDDFFAGKFDLMGGTFYSEGYEQYFAYPDYNCGYSRMVLLARKNDASIQSYDLRTLNGKTIGVYERAEENIRRLKEYLSIQGLDCTIKYYPYEDLSPEGNLYAYLKNGEVDMLLGNNADTDEDFYAAVAFDAQAHYIVTTPGNQEILDGLNMALSKIYASDPNFASKKYEANFQNIAVGYTELTAEEKAYVEDKQTVTVAIADHWHPLFCLNNDDYHDGLVPDTLKAVADFSGLSFQYLTCASYIEAVDMVRRQEADMLGFFVGSEEDAMAYNLALTAPFADAASILVCNKNTTYPAEGLIGGVLEGRRMPAEIVAEEVRSYANLTDALVDVNRGQLDFFYGLSASVEDTIRKENLSNIVQVSLINNTSQLNFALPKPVDDQLFSILNKAINSMTSEQKATISSRNVVSISDAHITLTGLIYANPTLAVTVVAFLLGFIVLVVLLAARIRVHTVMMQSELSKAEADSRAKSQFLSRMSHEIRTPMNAIVGLADLTEMLPDLPDKAQVNLNKIKTSSHYLLNLINDILDMSRIESGKLELAQAPFSLSVLLGDMQSMLNNDALNRQLDFQIEADIQNDVVIGDSVRLRQVVLNLLSNAFKFTPAGGKVLLSLQEEVTADGESLYTFRVVDNGIGISPEDQERIFQSFEQVGPNITKSQGTGLGLAISQNFVELMGGNLILNSTPGQGSTFHFTIPLPQGQLDDMVAAEQIQETGQLQAVHILLAEDNDLNAEIAIELLQIQGAIVQRAANGRQALEQFASQPPGSFQIILMDILMPEMNGLQAASAIRSLERPDAQTIPIIAMTANTFQEDVDAALAAGMTGFVPKPVDVNNLYEQIAEALNPKEA